MTIYLANYVQQFLIALVYFEKRLNASFLLKNMKNYYYFASILCSHESLNVFWSNVKALQPVFLTFDAKLTPILQITIISYVIFQFSIEITTNFWYKVVKIPINRYFQVQI